MDDVTLVARVRDGNTHAFRFLVDKYRNLVWHMVLRMIDRREDAEDLCQDVFLRVFRDIGKFRGDAKLSTWIGSIAYHVCIDHLRRNKRDLVTAVEQFTPAMLAKVDIPENIGGMDRTAIKKLVHRVIDAMPYNYRIVITLFHLEGFSYREIEVITGMPEGTIKSYLNRGRQIIHDKMLAQVPEIKAILFETN
jgi:RNA polymerase sigma-70 factor (ECF subfamily)